MLIIEMSEFRKVAHVHMAKVAKNKCIIIFLKKFI